MNVKVSDIIQYYAYKIIDGLGLGGKSVSISELKYTKKIFVSSQLFTLKIYAKYGFLTDFELKWVSV